jgi:LysM repeat protein
MARYGWVRRGDVLRNMAWYTHKVKSGDTLASIAKSVKPAQSVDYIKKWNGLSSDKVTAGQTIKVYPYYIVQWGDTLGDVAKSFNTTYQKLHGVNPWIKNVNLIYPKEKIRLLEGMEPEEKPPAPKPQPKPQPKPEPDTPPGGKQERDGAAPDYSDDDFPAHRKIAGDYYLRIGDVQFAVPPEFIQVHKGSNYTTGNMMRQKESFKFKHGQSSTSINLQLWFTNLEEINGFEVVSPIEGQKYYMDGLRPLIAQFKRQPFLPIINEYLNDVMDIHAVALTNLSFTTIEGFPDMIQANLSLQKMEVDMYIGKPSWTYDQHFMYPVFRWYYNQMLQPKKPFYSNTYMKVVEEANFTDKISFSILNEGFLRQQEAEHKLKTVELEDMAYDKIELPDDLICTSIFGSMGNMLAPIRMDMRETSTYQYLGGTDTMFQLTFETMNRDAVALLEKMYTTTERLSRQYKDKIVTGYLKVENSILNMAGVWSCMVVELVVATVPNMPDVFQIQMSLLSFRDNQGADQRLNGYNIVDSKDASDVAKGKMGVADKYLGEKKEPWFITEEGIAEGMLDTLELYPDLELPTYGIINGVLTKIHAHRKKQGHSKLYLDTYQTPRTLYRDYGKQNFTTRYLPDTTFVDPDFYFTYPDWSKLKMLDTSLINNNDLDVKLGNAIAASNGEGNYGAQGPSGLPKGSSYNGPKTSPHHARQGKSSLTNVDKWDHLIMKAANDRGINPVFLKCITAMESNGNIPTKPNAYNCYGIIQVQKNSANSSKYDWNRMLGTSEADLLYQLNAGIDVVESKLTALKNLQKKYPNSRWTNNPEIQMVANLYYGDDNNGKTYGESILQWYTGLGYSKSDGVKSGATGGGGNVDVSMANADILKNAEASVLVPIPKDDKEEQKIKNDNDNPDTMMKAMLHDMVKYSHRGNMNRAFPTYVLAFVDEGMWVDYRRLWNNYYTYHAVQEVMVVKERNNPVDTAYLKLQNIYGALNTVNKPDFKANNSVAFPGWQKTMKSPGSTIKWWWNTWFPKVDENMVKARMQHIQESGFYLRAGARVHLRMGYGSVASQMPITFNGRVTETGNDTQGADVVEIICQSDGLELVEPYYEWANDSRVTWWNLKQEPKNIIDSLLVDRKGLDWLANYNGGLWSKSGTQSKYGIEHFGYVIGRTDNEWYNFFGDVFKGLFGAERVNGYDVRKNIYNANGRGVFGKSEGDKDENNIHFWQTGKSVWDVVQILASVTPDYEVKVHEHNFHSTLFFGEPHWYVKYGYFNSGKDATKVSNYKEVLKPSQQFHHIDSMHDIISNVIKASGSHICTTVVPIYSYDEKPKAADTLFADPNIKPEMQKTDIVDTSLLQDFPMSDWLADATRWVGNALEETVKSIVGLWSDSLNNKDYISEHSRTERLAMEAGKTHIQTKFREMYQGEFVIIGDSAIKPGDLLSVADAYEQMFGNVEVGRVVHVMGFDHGFTTNLKPDLLAVRKDGKRAELLPKFTQVGMYLALTTMRRLMRRYFFKKPSKMTSALTSSFRFINNFRKIRNTATAASGVLALGGPPGWAAIIAELALFVVSELIINAIEKALNPQRAGVIIMPLWWKNRPYVAGIDGHKELIPGYWDENIYGPISKDSNPGTGTGSSDPRVNNNLDHYTVPEGYRTCTPTLNQRMTAPYWEYRTKADGWSKNYYHKGIDYGAITRGKDGDPILAVAGGEVIESKTMNGYGECIIIKHKFKDPVKWKDAYGWFDGDLTQFYTLYAHLSKRLAKKGDKVNVGDVVGLMGNTGGSFGTHLHFEFRTASLKNGNLPGFFDITPTEQKWDPAEFLKYSGAYKFPKDVWKR